jgi:hypothetical protein
VWAVGLVGEVGGGIGSCEEMVGVGGGNCGEIGVWAVRKWWVWAMGIVG